VAQVCETRPKNVLAGQGPIEWLPERESCGQPFVKKPSVTCSGTHDN